MPELRQSSPQQIPMRVLLPGCPTEGLDDLGLRVFLGVGQGQVDDIHTPCCCPLGFPVQAEKQTSGNLVQPFSPFDDDLLAHRSLLKPPLSGVHLNENMQLSQSAPKIR